jgi:hypothetical protein
MRGMSMTEKDFKTVQLLQQHLLSWINGVPTPNIKDVITNTMIIILRHSHLFENNECLHE